MLQKPIRQAVNDKITSGKAASMMIRFVNNNHRAGFGAIELLTVLAVIAILAAVAVPAYDYAVRKARRTEGRTALTTLMQQQERHYTQHSTYVAFSADVATDTAPESRPGWFKWYSADSPKDSAYEISARRCEGQSVRECILLSATPGSSLVGVAFRDGECGVLSLRSDGSRTASGSGKDCW